MNLKTVTIADLEPHPENPNTHPAKQIDALGDSLDEFDQVKNVVIWRGLMLAGHAVREAAIKSGRLTLEAVDVSHWDEAKAKAFMLADIRLPDMGIYDEAAMAEALRHIDEPLDIPGFDEDFLAKIGLEAEEPKEPAPPQIDRADELRQEWTTELGQLWALGDHRLVIGDCMDRRVVERVTEGDVIQGIVTDPPYSFGLSSTSQMATKSGGWHDMMNNASWFSELYREWEKIITNGPLWVFCNWRTLPILMRATFDSSVGIDSLMVWYKDWIGPGGMKGLRPTYELIAFTAIGNYAIPDRNIQDFIKIPWSSHKPTGHRAEKPLDLLIELLKISEINLILDPFLGSGTTLIACEQLNRHCRAIEIDPNYVAVTLQRFLDHTGIKAQLL
ncbi:MAG: DNA modification methylase [Planctomycetota bacterium]|jgi:DNA modification methylase